MNSKKLMLGSCLAIVVAGVALAQTFPSYKSFQAVGTTSAAVIIDPYPTSQIRVISAIESSDLSTSTLTFYSGTTAHYIAVTNATGQTTVNVESTNGIVANALVYIKGPSTNGVFTVNTVPTATTFTTTGAIGFAQTLNSEVEVLSSAAEILSVGANASKVFASDGLFVGNYGRAVYAAQTGTSVCTNYITVHYDATSQ